MSFIRFSLSRTRVASALILGAAFVLAVGCSDDNNKRTLVPGAEGGEGGAAGAAEMSAGSAGRVPNEAAGAIEPGAAGTIEPGAAGASDAPQGGAAGSTEVPLGSAGSAGAMDSTSAGSGGEAGSTSALACVPSGNVSDPAFPIAETYTVCPGAAQFVGYTASDSDGKFTCCGVSDTETPYSLELLGLKSGNGEGGNGQFAFIVPDDAPYGAQTISATCSSGPVHYTLALVVSDASAPIVTSATASLPTNGNMVIKGSHLRDVTDIIAVDADGNRHVCNKNSDTVSDTQISCNFGDDVSAGDYQLFVATRNCGYAVNVLDFTLVDPPIISANKLH